MARGVRQGCPAVGFLFAMAFDPIFRWLQEVVIPRNPDNLDFLQPTQCAYADDFAVAALSFRSLMTALAPFRSVDYIVGLNLNYRRCRWVQYGTEGRESLWHWLSKNCEEFREMQSVRHAKYVGTMISPDGHIHRWSANRTKFIQRVLKINASTNSLVERLCDFKIYAISVLSFICSVCAPDKATLKADNHALQCTTAGPYNAIPCNLLRVCSICGLGPDLVGIHSMSFAARYRVAACSTSLSQGLEKIQTARGHFALLFSLSLPAGKKNSLLPPWPVAPRMLSILFVVWTVMANLMKFRRMRNIRLPLDYTFRDKYTNKTLLGLFPVEPRKSWDRSVVIELRTSCTT